MRTFHSARALAVALAALTLASTLPATAAEPGADLVNRGVGPTSARPVTGDPLRFEGSFEVLGGNVTSSFWARFYLDGALLSQWRYASASGSQRLLSEAWNATTGNHTIAFVVDDADEVNETNETNNAWETTFTVQASNGTPDLIVSNLTFSPAAPREGDNVTITATVRNAGDGNATGAIAVEARVDDASLGVRSVSAPSPGQVRVVNFTWRANGTGTHRVTAVADAHDNVSESNETNNELLRLVDVGAASRNAAARLLDAPWGATEGTWHLLRGIATNTGNGTLEGLDAQLWLDGDILATRSSGSLGRNQSMLLSAPWQARPGWHTLTLVVDPYGEIDETDESDNVASIGFYVAPLTDLSVEILGVERERLQTDVGDAPNPHARRIVRMEVVNHQNDTLFATIVLSATGELRHTGLSTSAFVNATSFGLTPFASRTIELVWDPLVTVGDVTLHASVAGSMTVDERPEDNEDTHKDFVLVGGLGGVALT